MNAQIPSDLSRQRRKLGYENARLETDLCLLVLNEFGSKSQACGNVEVDMRENAGLKAHDGFSILAIGAHPDDIELGCGGSLAKLAAAGSRIQAVILSKGRRGTLSDADRERESYAAFAALGVRDIVIYDFEDTKLTYSLNEMIRTLDEHVRSFKPNRVYTMFQHDRHQDHRAVYEASAVSCRNVPQLLGYETPSSYPNFTPTVFESIDGHLKTKVRALGCHKSQGERLYMQEENVRSAASFRGAQVLLGPCEGFTPYKMIL